MKLKIVIVLSIILITFYIISIILPVSKYFLYAAVFVATINMIVALSIRKIPKK